MTGGDAVKLAREWVETGRVTHRSTDILADVVDPLARAVLSLSIELAQAKAAMPKTWVSIEESSRVKYLKSENESLAAERDRLVAENRRLVTLSELRPVFEERDRLREGLAEALDVIDGPFDYADPEWRAKREARLAELRKLLG